jgi:hypothetical protein
MKLRTLGIALASTALMTTAAMAEDVTLTIESWRTDDLTLWQDKIIPAFEKDNPGIKVVFSPTAPTEYNAALNSKLEAGSAGDLITCRPFDASLALFEAGHLAALDDMDAMSNFSDVAKSAWQTDDASALSASRWPPSSTASSTTRMLLKNLALRLQPPKPSSSRCWIRSRKTAAISRWPWAPTTSGKRPPWATTTSARTIGKAKKAVSR